MKKIIYITIAAVLSPSIVLASWWNPASWFRGHSANYDSLNSSNDTKILERRILELENKIKSMTPTASTTIQIATSTTVIKPIKTEDKKVVPATNTNTKVAPTLIPTESIKDYKLLYNTVLIPEYVTFRDATVTSEINSLPNNVALSNNQVAHRKYLVALSDILDSDVGELVKYNSSKYDYYASKIRQMTGDYEIEIKRYAKQNVIDYIAVNKFDLYKSAIHV